MEEIHIPYAAGEGQKPIEVVGASGTGKGSLMKDLRSLTTQTNHNLGFAFNAWGYPPSITSRGMRSGERNADPIEDFQNHEGYRFDPTAAIEAYHRGDHISRNMMENKTGGFDYYALPAEYFNLLYRDPRRFQAVFDVHANAFVEARTRFIDASNVAPFIVAFLPHPNMSTAEVEDFLYRRMTGSRNDEIGSARKKAQLAPREIERIRENLGYVDHVVHFGEGTERHLVLRSVLDAYKNTEARSVSYNNVPSHSPYIVRSLGA